MVGGEGEFRLPKYDHLLFLLKISCNICPILIYTYAFVIEKLLFQFCYTVVELSLKGLRVSEVIGGGEGDSCTLLPLAQCPALVC